MREFGFLTGGVFNVPRKLLRSLSRRCTSSSSTSGEHQLHQHRYTSATFTNYGPPAYPANTVLHHRLPRYLRSVKLDLLPAHPFNSVYQPGPEAIIIILVELWSLGRKYMLKSPILCKHLWPSFPVLPLFSTMKCEVDILSEQCKLLQFVYILSFHCPPFLRSSVTESSRHVVYARYERSLGGNSSAKVFTGLVQFIADLRNARARELEEKRINKELANIRSALIHTRQLISDANL